MIQPTKGAARITKRCPRGTWACGLFAVFFLSGCSTPLNEAECFELLDTYTDKLVQQARPSASSAERSEIVFQARQKALLDPEFNKCPERVSRSQYKCALQAVSVDEIERCLL